MFESGGDVDQDPDGVAGSRAATLQLFMQWNPPTLGGDQSQCAVGQTAAIHNRDNAAVGMSLECLIFLQQLSGLCSGMGDGVTNPDGC